MVYNISNRPSKQKLFTKRNVLFLRSLTVDSKDDLVEGFRVSCRDRRKEKDCLFGDLTYDYKTSGSYSVLPNFLDSTV